MSHPDVDIDFANRDQVLELLDLTPASIIRDGKLTRHNTGVYATDIPVDPFTGSASLPCPLSNIRMCRKPGF